MGTVYLRNTTAPDATYSNKAAALTHAELDANLTFFLRNDTSDTMAGSLTCTGNVTAYSDERLKKDWKPLPDNFVEELSKLLHGTYTRTDTEEEQAGVSAQQLQKLLAQVVGVDPDSGYLTVAYGNAAMVAAIALAGEVVSLKRELATIKQQLGAK